MNVFHWIGVVLVVGWLSYPLINNAIKTKATIKALEQRLDRLECLHAKENGEVCIYSYTNPQGE